MERKSRLLTILLSSPSSIFFWNSGLWRYEIICERTCIHSVPCNSKVYFSLIVLYLQRIQPYSHSLYSKFVFFQHYIFSKTLQPILFSCRPSFLWVNFFDIIVKNARALSLESLVFIPFVSTVLSNRFWRTSRYLHRYYLWLVYQRMLSPYTKFHFGILQMPPFSWIYA